MSPSSVHDPPASHIDVTDHRKDAAKQKEMKPLLTREPLPHNRGPKPPAAPPRRRKRPTPDKPPLGFHPKQNSIPSGRQDPPVPSPVLPRPPVSEPPTISYRGQQTVTFADRQIHDRCHDGYGHSNTYKRLRVSSEFSSTEQNPSSYPNTPCADVSDSGCVLADPYDSPVSYTSSSSPTPSDQSSGAADIAVPVITPYHQYSGQVLVPQPVVHQDTYSYPMDPCPNRTSQNYPVQYFDATYGRAGPHGVPAYLGDDSYAYPPRF